MKITIGHLYPDLLNLYGDRGNIQCMMKRCQWRGIEAETLEFKLEDEVDFSKLDIVLLGGGSDREQMIVCKSCSRSRKTLRLCGRRRCCDRCLRWLSAAWRLLSDGRRPYGRTAFGQTPHGAETGRLISNIVLKSDLFDMPVVGFENHGGRYRYR